MIKIILITVCAILIMPGLGAYAQEPPKIEPIAQVYEVQGEVTVKSQGSEGNIVVEKGILLSKDDILNLKEGASVGLYFKDGGRRELKAEGKSQSFEMRNLLPKREAYEGKALAFGATRGISTSAVQTFFYPQRTVVVNSLPLIEFTVFNGSGQAFEIPQAIVSVSDENKVVDSTKFSNLALEAPYTYFFKNLGRGREYGMEIQLEIKEIPDRPIVFNSKFYVADIPDKSSLSQYRSFGDPLYRSAEFISADYEGRTYKFWFLKHLEFKEDKDQPIILIEIFIA
jgi:hypothetical protein